MNMITRYTQLAFLLTGFIQDVLSLQLVRIGSEWGGWTIPAHLLNSQSICYCAGAGDDISFDLGIVNQYGCHVYIFDPTQLAIDHVAQCKQKLKRGESYATAPHNYPYCLAAQKVDNVHFFSVGLWDSNRILKFFEPKNPSHASYSILNLQKTNRYFEAQCKTLKTIMSELGHTKIDLLKLDIEGAEYAVLNSIFQDNLDIACICIEFDEVAGLHRVYNTDIEGSIARICYYIKLLKQHGYHLIYANDYTDMTFLKQPGLLSS